MTVPSIEYKETNNQSSYHSVEMLTKESLSLDNSLLQTIVPTYRVSSTKLKIKTRFS